MRSHYLLGLMSIVMLSSCGKSMQLTTKSHGMIGNTVSADKSLSSNKIDLKDGNNIDGKITPLTVWDLDSKKNPNATKELPFVVKDDPNNKIRTILSPAYQIEGEADKAAGFNKNSNMIFRAVTQVPPAANVKFVSEFKLVLHGVRLYAAGDKAADTLKAQILCAISNGKVACGGAKVDPSDLNVNAKFFTNASMATNPLTTIDNFKQLSTLTDGGAVYEAQGLQVVATDTPITVTTTAPVAGASGATGGTGSTAPVAATVAGNVVGAAGAAAATALSAVTTTPNAATAAGNAVGAAAGAAAKDISANTNTGPALIASAPKSEIKTGTAALVTATQTAATAPVVGDLEIDLKQAFGLTDDQIDQWVVDHSEAFDALGIYRKIKFAMGNGIYFSSGEFKYSYGLTPAVLPDHFNDAIGALAVPGDADITFPNLPSEQVASEKFDATALEFKTKSADLTDASLSKLKDLSVKLIQYKDSIDTIKITVKEVKGTDIEATKKDASAKAQAVVKALTDDSVSATQLTTSVKITEKVAKITGTQLVDIQVSHKPGLADDAQKKMSDDIQAALKVIAATSTNVATTTTSATTH